MTLRNAPRSLLDREILRRAARDSVRKLDPRRMARNPVMFVSRSAACSSPPSRRRPERVRLADRGLALVHGAVRELRRGDRRGPRQGAGRELRQDARRDDRAPAAGRRRARGRPSSELHVGDEVVVSAGELIPADGEVIEGIASVDESAITGESAPVIRESGGDRSAVTGGTRVLSDRIVVRSRRSRARASSTG